MPELPLSAIWPIADAKYAVTALAAECRMATENISANAAVNQTQNITELAASLGLEAEEIDTFYTDVDTLLTQAAGVILRVKVDQVDGLVLILKGGRYRLTVLTRERRILRVSSSTVRNILCASVEEGQVSNVALLLAAIPLSRHASARTALFRTQLANERIFCGWLLRPAPSASFVSQIHHFGFFNRAWRLVTAHIVAYCLWISTWWLLGAAALSGHYDPGWWQAWLLLLVTLTVLQAQSGRWQTELLTGLSALLKRRLLHGALRMQQDFVRHEGAGQLLGRVLEAEAIEGLALNGGLAAALALLEAVLVMLLLVIAVSGGVHATLLAFWLVVIGICTWQYVRQRRTWTLSRLDLTHHLTEQMLGHRTRLVQQPISQWHDSEDVALCHYNVLSKGMDTWAIAVSIWLPRAWLIVSLLALAPAIIAGSSATTLAVIVGGSLLALAAFRKLTQGLLQLAAAGIAWNRIEPIFRAGGAASNPGIQVNIATDSTNVLSAQNIVFRYGEHGQALLQGVDLQVRRGERILLEGASGGGKSTLANILTGSRVADSGLLLLGGMDRQTLGDGWRRLAVNVPQFHENFILSESFAFNVLIGRNWPPSAEDLKEAEALCASLGLEELLARMPGGMWQMIGENGWRLSHGERSRVFLARALLQPAMLMVFDESFAALDPENLGRAMECVVEKAPSLIVIAHP